MLVYIFFQRLDPIKLLIFIQAYIKKSLIEDEVAIPNMKKKLDKITNHFQETNKHNLIIFYFLIQILIYHNSYKRYQHSNAKYFSKDAIIDKKHPQKFFLPLLST